MNNLKEKLKNIQFKKLIKALTMVIGFALVTFMSFFSASFDFTNIDWAEWAANSSILVGIMIFGILMGLSIGTDTQKEKIVRDDEGKIIGGRFQVACTEYNVIREAIEQIKYYFSQFWLWYKERKLIEKKIDFLVDNQFDTRVATILVKNIELDDCVEGKLLFTGDERIYVKNGIKIKKLTEDRLDIVKKIFKITLDTFKEGYYLYLFDDGDNKTNEAEKAKKIAEKIEKDRKNTFIIKIVSSIAISIVWSAITVKEFVDGGDDIAVKKAWLNLLSRISALITSFVSGYSTSVVNVRDQASAIENKVSILKEFKNCYDNGLFIPETYEEMIEREYQEDNSLKKEESNL